MQLAEVKAICTVLFQAKINSLDNIRRERVSEDDLKGPQTDYLPEKSVTNELAVLSPYEVTFRCFSSELAAVLAGFASFALRPAGQDHQRRIGASRGRQHRAGCAASGSGGGLRPAFRGIPSASEARARAESALSERYGLRGREALGDRYGRGGPGMLMPRPAPQPAYVPAPARPRRPAGAASPSLWTRSS